MAESLNSKRVIFPSGKQREFLLTVKEKLGIDSKALAKLAGTGVRNLSTWRTEKGHMSFYAVEQLCKKVKILIPSGIEVRQTYWHVQEAAKKGGRARYEKYGAVALDEEARKKKWQEWWEREGKKRNLSVTKSLPFRKPVLSESLAEFVGIILGDGGIAQNQITVTLNGVDDKEYCDFVEKLIKELFEIPVGIYSNACSIAKRLVISRTALIEYLISEEVGLKRGNKVKLQVDIPSWVKECQPYAIACLRGLIDTDGCVIMHRYRSRGKGYSYKKVGFTSRSCPLLQSVSAILSHLGIKHRIMKNGWDIRIEAQKEVERYFQVVGTHNPKHMERYFS